MSNNSPKTRIFIFLAAGIFTAAGAFYVLSKTSSSGFTPGNGHGCLQTGRYILRDVYLDSMLYVNGNETQRLARYNVTQLFTNGQTITLDFSGSLNRRINNGEVTINYPGGFGITYNAEELSRELNECHRGLYVKNGKLMRNGQVQTDTLKNGNHITIRNRQIADFEGRYSYSNDSLTFNYTPAAEWQWKMPFDTLNPSGKAFVNYRGGNKVFRFVWVRQK